MFFHLSTLTLFLLIAGVLLGSMAMGFSMGRRSSRRSETLHEPFGIVQAALVTLVALIIAFCLSMSVNRYEARRVAAVNDANTIGTAYLRAQTLKEPVRSLSLPLYREYADLALALGQEVPGSAVQRRSISQGSELQRRLWNLAGEALKAEPDDNASRLYVQSLNEMIDQQATRVNELENRVPEPVGYIALLGAALATGLISFYLALLSRGFVTPLLASGFFILLLFVSFDLDRPARGFIQISDAPLISLRASMLLPPAAGTPVSP
ncbi:MAG: hypothetical protein WCJ67_08055 [Thermoleophilia bacterium]